MNSAKQILRIAAVVLVCLGLGACSSKESVFFDIPEGPAGVALNAFASQSSTEIIYSVEEMQAIRTNRVYGRYTREQALEKLLDGSALVYGRDEKSGAIAVWNSNLKNLN